MKLDHGCSLGLRSAPSRHPGALIAFVLGGLLTARLCRRALQVT